MQVLHRKITGFLFLTLLALIIMITACEQQEIIGANTLTEDDKTILNFLATQGMHAHDISFEDDYVLYEEDAGWDKSFLLEAARGEIQDKTPFDPNPAVTEDLEEETGSRQQGIQVLFRGNAVQSHIVNNIKFFIDPSLAADCGSAWRTATLDAVEEWNDILDSRVNLTRVFSSGSADIIIGSDRAAIMPASHTNIGSIGRGDFSASGRPGRWISINDTADNWSAKKKTMMHEIGHNLGYRHTGTNDGQHIHTTATNPSQSIMHQGSGVPAVFTTDDKRAIRMYYPSSLNAPSISVRRIGSGRVQVTYTNPNNSTKPYFWIRGYRFNNAGNVIGTRTIRAEVNGSGRQTFDWSALGIGNNRFEVRGINLRRDIFSPASLRVSAN